MAENPENNTPRENGENRELRLAQTESKTKE